MIQSLMVFTLSLDVLKEENLKEFRFQVYVHYPWAHLNNGNIKNKYIPYNRQP
jgi:hypothetical protein